MRARSPALVLLVLLALAAATFGAPSNDEQHEVDSDDDGTDYTRFDQDEEGAVEDGDLMDFCVQLERVHGSSSAMGAALGALQMALIRAYPSEGTPGGGGSGREMRQTPSTADLLSNPTGPGLVNSSAL